MPAAFASAVIPAKVNPRFLPFIDRLLITGLKLGDAGKHEAINKVLKLVPEWRRGDCWRRIRQLRRASSAGECETSCRYIRHSASESREFHARSAARPWTAEEDAKLLDWAGYEPVDKISLRLNRSVRAVRFRLGALGMSAKVSDGWSQRSLAKLLHISVTQLRRLVGSGILRVRDPRITTNSMLALSSSNGLLLDHSASERITAMLSKVDAYPWERAAGLLGIDTNRLQTLICQGKLKVLDPFVTDRSFEEFCRKHGDQINMPLIDQATAKWLVEEYGVANGNVRPISRAQKHALVIRKCGCGKKIAGNIFYRHVKHCRVVTQQEHVMDRAA